MIKEDFDKNNITANVYKKTHTYGYGNNESHACDKNVFVDVFVEYGF